MRKNSVGKAVTLKDDIDNAVIDALMDSGAFEDSAVDVFIKSQEATKLAGVIIDRVQLHLE